MDSALVDLKAVETDLTLDCSKIGFVIADEDQLEIPEHMGGSLSTSYFTVISYYFLRCNRRLTV
jgi:hypothetical protein